LCSSYSAFFFFFCQEKGYMVLSTRIEVQETGIQQDTPGVD